MRWAWRAATLGLLTAAASGCRDDTVVVPEAQSESGGESHDSSAAYGCGAVEEPVLVLNEGEACSFVPFGLDVQLSPWESNYGPGTYDVLDPETSGYGWCRHCIGSDCELATACAVEITELTNTRLVADVDAEFPSGPITRHFEAEICMSMSLCW